MTVVIMSVTLLYYQTIVACEFIVFLMLSKDDGLTKEISGTDADAKSCCLSDDIILKLAAIGVEVMK